MKALRYSGAAAVALLALVAAFVAWEAAFASIVGLRTHSWTLWSRFYHGLEWSLPVRTAYSQWSVPLVRKISGQAWLAALVAGAGVTFGLFEIAQNFRGVRPPAGGSRLATRSDLRRAGLLNGKPGYSVFLGRFQGRDLRYSGASHIYVNGPTRSGKGVGFVLPNALEWRGSLIGLDLKREMWNEIGAARAAMGQDVFLFSPGSPESHAWNPLDLVAPWPERATDVSNVARSLIPLPASGDPYWAETARGLFAGLLAYVLESPRFKRQRTIKSALKMFSQGEPLYLEMSAILSAEPSLNEFIRDKFRQHIGREEKARQSFESHVITALDAWNNSLVDAATARSDFNIANLRRRPFTILIGAPIGNFGSVEAVVRLLIQQVHDVLLKNLPGPDEPHRLLLMLDEFFQFGRMPEIVDRAPLVAGYGFQIAVIAQGLTQLDVRYGRPTRDMMVGNMDVKLMIAVGDEVTATYCSDELGEQYVQREAWGTSRGLRGGAQTRQARWDLDAIMPENAVRRLDPKKAMLLVRGHPGAVIDKAFFFKDAAFTRQVAAAASRSGKLSIPDVAGTKTSVPFKTELAPSGANQHELARLGVLDAAREVFLETSRFETAFAAAMSEPQNQAIAELCKSLRTNPTELGALRPRRKRRFGAGESPEAVTLRLRTEIIAARRALNDSRAEYVGDAMRTASWRDGSTDPSLPATSSGGAPSSGSSSVVGELPELPNTEQDVLNAVGDVGARAGKLAGTTKEAKSPPDAHEQHRLLIRYAAELKSKSALFADTPDDLGETMGE
jgi:type IV secretion system protein VirD4